MINSNLRQIVKNLDNNKNFSLQQIQTGASKNIQGKTDYDVHARSTPKYF